MLFLLTQKWIEAVRTHAQGAEGPALALGEDLVPEGDPVPEDAHDQERGHGQEEDLALEVDQGGTRDLVQEGDPPLEVDVEDQDPGLKAGGADPDLDHGEGLAQEVVTGAVKEDPAAVPGTVGLARRVVDEADPDPDHPVGRRDPGLDPDQRGEVEIRNRKREKIAAEAEIRIVRNAKTRREKIPKPNPSSEIMMRKRKDSLRELRLARIKKRKNSKLNHLIHLPVEKKKRTMLLLNLLSLMPVRKSLHRKLKTMYKTWK